MKDLRESFDVKKKKKTPNIDIWNWVKKNRKNILFILIAFIVINILFNPENTAEVISNWINNFIGTFNDNIDL